MAAEADLGKIAVACAYPRSAAAPLPGKPARPRGPGHAPADLAVEQLSRLADQDLLNRASLIAGEKLQLKVCEKYFLIVKVK